MRRVCVNCGSSPGYEPCYMEMADVGLMGQVADEAMRNGGKVNKHHLPSWLCAFVRGGNILTPDVAGISSHVFPEKI